MIYDSIKNIENYKGIHKNVYDALVHLAQNDFKHAKPGRNDVDGDRIYYNFVADGETVTPDRNTFEAHRAYVDIHVDVRGEETVYTADVSHMNVTKEYDAEGDYLLCDGKPEAVVFNKPGTFVVCFPSDAHMPMCSDVPAKITKAIYKVRLD